MTPQVHKFGRFFLLPFNDENEVLDFLSSDKSAVPEITGFAPSATRDCSTSQFYCASLQNWSFTIKSLSSFLKKLSSRYVLLINAEKEISMRKSSLHRMITIAENGKAGIVYSDFMLGEGKKLIKHPLIDYQTGSIRDDFKFGHLLILSCAAIQSALQKYGSLPSDTDTALYDLRLKISADYEVIHVPEFLYTVSAKEKKIKKTGSRTEAHFAYVAKENFRRQKKFEKIATGHLKRIGAYLPQRTKTVNKEEDEYQWKASVIIPVLNRKKTIADALKSALGQKTDFPFNIIVVDNHSTDGTTVILKKFAAMHPHIYHILPSRKDLGIGGCWNEAIYSPYCGRYVVQLDSDDLYRSSQSLQKIVNTMRRERYAMVVGSYTIVNERLKKIPPGLIDHREWTQKNGHNNLLRVNGLGAPRAFDLSVLRRIGFPNVSYGEDYAVALRITREYKIGRIYENLYWCRRWKDNTDAGLSIQKQNANDFYKDKLRATEIETRKWANKREIFRDSQRIFAEFSDNKNLSLPLLCQRLYNTQKKTWLTLAESCGNLAAAHSRKLSGAYKVYLQFNPARALSSGAAVDKESIKNRPCFLCENNLPLQQLGVLYRNQYLILCNPAPIFQHHFTIVSLKHEPQDIASSMNGLLQLSADMPGYAVFYNGPACGASAPDHLHFQAVPHKFLPFLRELKKLSPVKETSPMRYSRSEIFDRSVVALESKNAEALTEQFLNLLRTTRKILKINNEPPVNVICYYSVHCWKLVVFMRKKHRPDSYFAKGDNRIFISPGAVDMAGVVITPLLDNYNRLNYNTVRGIYSEVSLPGSVMNLIVKELYKGTINEWYRRSNRG